MIQAPGSNLATVFLAQKPGKRFVVGAILKMDHGVSLETRGRMIGGFALIAWPVKYGETGVMTFSINQAGQVYRKDLGPDTTAIAKRIQAFNPDSSWFKVDSTR